ncbi:MAG TPA: hypothetical protein PKE21_14495 [Flavobacteriales bacterium]|nr:hypothetical protein [Flavobacteriales bacterium]HMR28689.1 hypothetical protein [Flavobacteriales bacterium]
MNTLMLSCRKATHLMERRTMEELGTLGRMQLWVHLRVCDGCRAFQKQNAQMDVLMKNREPVDASVDTTVLEKRILTALEKGPGPID